MEFVVNSNDNLKRIDSYLSARFFDVSRSSFVKLIESGKVLVNNNRVQKKYIPNPGDVIRIVFENFDLNEDNIIPKDIPIDIIYEDDYIIVVNKQKGMVVHPAAGHLDDTLVNALKFHTSDLSDINSKIRPGIVHRLDKDTSGVLLVAKNNFVHEHLANQIKNKFAKRQYIGIVHGVLKCEKGKIDLPIARDQKNRKKMSVTEKNSKHAVTNYEVIKSSKKYSFVKFLLETGRTHQIRVHLSKIGHPLAGDVLYGAAYDPRLHGQCLHAQKIGFIHPILDKYMEFYSKPPDEFLNFLKQI